MKPPLRMRLEGAELIRRPIIQEGVTIFTMVATEALRTAAAALEEQLYDAIVAVCRQRFDAVPEETVLESVLATVRERRGRLVWSLAFSERYTTLTELNTGEPYTLDIECRGVWVSSLTDIRLDLKLLQVAVDERAEAAALEAERATLLQRLEAAVHPLRQQQEAIQVEMRRLEEIREAVVGAKEAADLEVCRRRLEGDDSR